FDARHIRRMIGPIVFVVSEQEIIFQKDGVVPDVRAPDRVENFRPDVSMIFLVTFDVARFDSNHESKRLHATPYPPSRNRPAAASGVISGCGVASISNPTINLRIFAERSSGG